MLQLATIKEILLRQGVARVPHALLGVQLVILAQRFRCRVRVENLQHADRIVKIPEPTQLVELVHQNPVTEAH